MRGKLCFEHKVAAAEAAPPGHLTGKVVRVAVVGIVIAAALAAGCGQKAADQGGGGTEKKDEPEVKRGPNGEIVVTLDTKTQEVMGLRMAALAPAQLNPEVKGYGRVLDASPLASLVAELTSARAASEASQAELLRLKTLAAQSNASERALQAAEAAATRDRAQVEAIRVRLVANWGTAIAAREDLSAFAQSLGSLESALVQIALPAGDGVKNMPTSARLITMTPESQPLLAKVLSPAPMVDPQAQGQGFLLLVSPNPAQLAPGAAVTGLLGLPGEPQSGVAVPREAIIRYNGNAWVYLQTAPDFFTRVEVTLDRPLENGWFVREGLKPNDKVVIVGAQQLLSEELKGE